MRGFFLFPIIFLITAQASTSPLKSISSFDDECGVPGLSAFVSGGKKISPNEFPWIAALMKYNRRGERSYQGGGTLVAFDVVITAAHCFVEKGESFPTQFDEWRVILGAHNLTVTGGDDQIVLKIAKVTAHPDWTNSNRANFAGDIAIIKLSEESARMLANSANDHIRPVCLPFGDEDDQTVKKITETKSGSVVGWGVYGDGLKTSDVPRKIDIPILSTIDCINKFPALAYAIWDEAFCSGNELAAVCKGDNGSGYLVKVGDRYYLRGVVSSGLVGEHGTCKKNSMTAFSDVVKYIDFIKEELTEKKSPLSANIECKNFFNSTGGGYSCFFNDIVVKSFNVEINEIITHHQPGQSDQVVERLVFNSTEMDFLPDFETNILKNKFLNAKKLDIFGSNGTKQFDMNAKNFDWSHRFTHIGFYKFYGKLNYLPRRLLRKSEQLRIFKICSSYVENIPKELFQTNYQLEEIVMINNKLNNLPSNLLSRLANLRMLHISDNNIDKIPKYFFSNNPELRIVFITSNKIKTLDSNTFEESTKLEKLHLNNNELIGLPHHFLKNATKLTHFEIKKNQLAEVLYNLFEWCENLKEVDFSHNKIGVVRAQIFEYNKKLEKINFSFNKITNLPSDFLLKMPNLLEFKISNNQITSVPPQFFSANPLLRKVELQQNKITQIAAETFKNLNLTHLQWTFETSKRSEDDGHEVFDEAELFCEQDPSNGFEKASGKND